MSKKAAARIEEVADIDDEDIPEAVDPDTLRQLIESRFGHMSLSSLPLSLRRRIYGLKSLQATQAKLEAQYREELLALERKYLGIYAPLWTRRAEIVAGTVEPSEEEAGYQSDNDEEEELDEEAKKAAEAQDAEADADTPKGIPRFWLTVLKMSPVTTDLITEKDEAALEHLTDVVLTYTDDNHGFLLEFKFSPNEFFDDASLIKTYFLENEASTNVQDLIYTKATGSTIHWKKDKDLTVTIETKKQRQKGTNKTRVVKRSVPTDSFFNFFNPPVLPEDEDEDVDPELQQRQEEDFEIGEMFKNKLVPRAIDWFTGKALEYEGYGEDEEYDEEEGEYDEEDEDEHDEDEEEEEEEEDHHGHSHAHGGHGHSHSHGGHGHSHSHGHAHGGKGGAKGGDKPEECKQQ